MKKQILLLPLALLIIASPALAMEAKKIDFDEKQEEDSTKIKAKDYKVLVLPSGGAAAIVSAELLQNIENQLGPIDKLFDEIWSSSAGSIITAFFTKSSNKQNKASEAVEFLEENFSSYYKAYFIRDTLKDVIKNSLLSETLIPVRILTAASKSLIEEKWELYDFSSDGTGSCSTKTVPIADIVKGSCTVYPYLYRSPVSIAINEKECMHCIDAGSLCVQAGTVDPTAYFLKQFINRLQENDTLTVYFLANAFTQSINQQSISDVLEEQTKTRSFAIRYQDGTFTTDERKQIEIVNIAVPTNCSTIVETYLNNASYSNKVKTAILKFIFEKALGKENALPNLIGAGTIPLSILKEESKKIIQSSQNYNSMLEDLKKYN